MISKAPSRRTNRSGQHGPEPDPPQAPAGRIAGWDIGGVHLKGAVVEAGTIVDAFRIPAALWTGLDALEAAFDRALGRIGPVERHGVTLTGELSDLFEDRVHGVERLVAAAAARLGPRRLPARPRSPPPTGMPRPHSSRSGAATRSSSTSAARRRISCPSPTGPCARRATRMPSGLRPANCSTRARRARP
jgi:hypothetical protein